MISRVFRLLTISTIAFVAIALMASNGRAQTGGTGGGIGGDTGGGGTGLGGDLGGTVGGNVGGGTTITGDNTGTNSGSGGGSGTAGEAPNLSDLINMNLDAEIPVIEDERRVGFVGPTNELGKAVSDAVPPTGFVGADSAPFTASGGATGGTTGRTGGATGTLGQQPGAGQQNGFVVTRRSIRSRVRAAFETLPGNGDFVLVQFQDRLQRQPATRSLASSFGQNVQVNVENRTAVVTGLVQSADEADRIVRQLRLEPGVYRIDNQLSVGN